MLCPTISSARSRDRLPEDDEANASTVIISAIVSTLVVILVLIVLVMLIIYWRFKLQLVRERQANFAVV